MISNYAVNYFFDDPDIIHGYALCGDSYHLSIGYDTSEINLTKQELLRMLEALEDA